MKIRILLYTFSLGFLFLCCTSNTVNITGSETTNGITIIAQQGSISGTAAPGLTVSLYDSAYSPYELIGLALTKNVDDSGKFEFASLPASYYNLFITNPLSDSGCYFSAIPVSPDTVPYEVTDSLTMTGTISGTVVNKMNQALDSTIAYIKGSSFCDSSDSDGTYIFSTVPRGNYSIDYIRIYKEGIWQPDTLTALLENIAVLSGESTELDSVVLDNEP